MPRLRDLPLVDASVRADASVHEAVSALFASRSPAIAVLDAEGHPVGVFAERDLLQAVFPGYLAEMRHTSFLPDDSAALDELARQVRSRSIGELARTSEVLRGDDSQVHAAERLMHTGEDALPVVDGERFLGMLSVAALCQARLDRAQEE
ncbi:MAG TPA: CBS domain-containing protein [Gaiellaceae bacterium]|nr:CBS domain-containing protein [Gaiellaceae bacterium]